MFTADIKNRGLVLDPRTKLAVMLTLVVFALGGTGSDIQAVRIGGSIDKRLGCPCKADKFYSGMF